MKGFFILLMLFGCFSSSAQDKMYSHERAVQDSINNNFLEINFTTEEDRITLSGTLAYPKATYDKVVIIVPGTGPDTRHSHFVLAENYLKNNVAVYRFDERGIGKSKGKYNNLASSLVEDIKSAYQTLRKHPKLIGKKIGVVGHSLGGIATIKAYDEGCDFDFMVQIGTQVEKGAAFLKYQYALSYDRGMKDSKFAELDQHWKTQTMLLIDTLSKMILITKDRRTIKKKERAIRKSMGIKRNVLIKISPFIIDLMQQNPEKIYKKADCPILYIIGGEDQLMYAPSETKVLKSLANPNIKIVIVPKVNHWLSGVEINLSNPSYYHMDAEALDKIITWTLHQ